MGIEMATERIAKLTIDELRAKLIDLQNKIEQRLNTAKKESAEVVLAKKEPVEEAPVEELPVEELPVEELPVEVDPKILLRDFYDAYENYIELKKGPDKELADPIASKLASTFVLASRAIRGDHGNSHHELWH